MCLFSTSNASNGRGLTTLHIRIFSTGQIWQICHRYDAPDNGVIEGWQEGDIVGKWGVQKLLRLMMLIGTVGFDGTMMFVFLMACTSVKKYGHHMILIWCHTNLWLLYMMVPSDWYRNAV
jgi:hypothetical protein